jgi:hypothetical protein
MTRQQRLQIQGHFLRLKKEIQVQLLKRPGSGCSWSRGWRWITLTFTFENTTWLRIKNFSRFHRRSERSKEPHLWKHSPPSLLDWYICLSHSHCLSLSLSLSFFLFYTLFLSYTHVHNLLPKALRLKRSWCRRGSKGKYDMWLRSMHACVCVYWQWGPHFCCMISVKDKPLLIR